MLICLSIAQILGHIYSIVDADLYTIHQEMLTLVELHRIRKNCSVKNNKIKDWAIWIFAWSKLIWKYNIFRARVSNLRCKHRQNFNVSIKKLQYRNRLPLAYLGLHKERKRVKPSNSLAKKSAIKTSWTRSSSESLVSIRWPRRPCCCCNGYMTTVINTSPSFHLRVSKGRWAKNNIFAKAKMTDFTLWGVQQTNTQALQ